jgi:Domain of unknown function (DUF6436)
MVVSTESALPGPVQRVPRMSTGLLWLIVAAWLGGAGYGIWFFELRLERPFVSAAHATLFESGAHAQTAEDWFRRSLAGPEEQAPVLQATVVHVYDAQCPCNRFSDPHLAKIEAAYRQRGVRFLRVERSSRIGAAARRWIESTPAALVFDARGKMVFFGPYSEGAACGATNGLVERVLDQVLSGRSPTPGLVISAGCFCSGKPARI